MAESALLEVEVPAGLVAGDVFAVLLPTSEELEITVPDGCSGGDLICVAQPESHDESSAAAERVEVTVPTGISEGEAFEVALGDGAVFEVVLPPGLMAGDTLEVEVPPQSLSNVAEPPSPPKEPLPAAPAPKDAPSTPPKRMAVSSAWDQASAQAESAMAHIAMTAANCAVATSGMCSSSSSAAATSSSRFGGSRFADRFSPSRQQQHFNSSSPSAKSTPKKVEAEYLLCRSDQLSTPSPEPGCRFYVGQPIQMLRASGEWSEGVILELPMPGLLTTMYRCRLGEGVLEKMVAEDEVRVPTVDPGFSYYRGQTVQIVRPSGLLELGTVLRTSMIDRTGSGKVEPWYAVRLHQSEITPGPNKVETLHDDDLQLPTPQAGTGFYVGELVHAQRKSGGKALCRVTAFERVGYSLGYKCEVVRLDAPQS